MLKYNGKKGKQLNPFMVFRDSIAPFIGFAYICLFQFLRGGKKKPHIES